MRRFLVIASALLMLAVPTWAYHDGDMIYGSVNGQTQVVDPTDMLTNPPAKPMVFQAATSNQPAYWIIDQGFDWFSIPGYGIDSILEVTLTPTYSTPGLLITDAGGNSYFTDGATNPTYRFKGNSRHKHFILRVLEPASSAVYEFRFKLTNPTLVNGGNSTDSPEYRIRYTLPSNDATIQLQNAQTGLPLPANQTVTIWWRLADRMQQQAGSTDAEGKVRIDLLPGRGKLSVRSVNCLVVSMDDIDVKSGQSSSQNFNLLCADPNGDNQVNLFDYVELDSSFGSIDAKPDLNYDGQINLFDYVVLDTAFGAVGSQP